MSKNKIILLISVFFGLFLIFSNASAFNCGERNIIGNTPPYFGNEPNQNVIVSQNSQARLSIKGEDGCAGQAAQYRIKRDGTTTTVSLILNKGQAVSGQTGAFILYGDLTADIAPGTYSTQLISVGGQVFQSADSSNTLTVQSGSQPCILSRLSTNPVGGVSAGQRIQLIVEAQGACQGWGVTVNVFGDFSICNFNGSEQKFSAGSNRLVWNWIPSNPAGPQAVCKFRANLDRQSLSSAPFTIQRISGGRPGQPGQPATVSFEIPNPASASSLVDLAKAIGKFIFQIAIPIAVIVIIYAGLLFLTSRGDVKQLTQAKQTLLYAVIGLAIILIGQGFFTLIKSILNLGTP